MVPVIYGKYRKDLGLFRKVSEVSGIFWKVVRVRKGKSQRGTMGLVHMAPTRDDS
jgi:hypothetical protein